MTASASDDLTAYARSLGIRIASDGGNAPEDQSPILTVDFGTGVEGRPGHYHGGAIGGLLETAGYTALRRQLAQAGRAPRLKPVNITVQFLAAGKARASFAKASVFRLGRRNAHIEVQAWQDGDDGAQAERRIIATAVMNILMVEEEEAGETTGS